MGKLTDKQRKEIILAYKLDNSKENIENIANQYSITKRRVFQIVKDPIDAEIEQSITNNSSYFTKRANEIIKKALDRLEKQIETDEKATISQISTAIGILYDKSRLENNLSTSNNEIKISIKVEK